MNESIYPLKNYGKIEETLNTYSHMFKNKLDDVVNTINKLT